MISGTTLTVGEASRGWIRRVTKVTIGVFCDTYLDVPDSNFYDYSYDMPRRRINPSSLSDRRKISPS